MFELFIAKRIYLSNDSRKQVSKPAVRIAMLGIAIGLAVMIVSVSVVSVSSRKSVKKSLALVLIYKSATLIPINLMKLVRLRRPIVCCLHWLR